MDYRLLGTGVTGVARTCPSHSGNGGNPLPPDRCAILPHSGSHLRWSHRLLAAFLDSRLDSLQRSEQRFDLSARIVASVDGRRVARIAKLLAEAGVEGKQALHRAAFLYWAYLGQAVVMDPRHSSMSAVDLFET